jgi:hypothetical protein
VKLVEQYETGHSYLMQHYRDIEPIHVGLTAQNLSLCARLDFLQLTAFSANRFRIFKI